MRRLTSVLALCAAIAPFLTSPAGAATDPAMRTAAYAFIKAIDAGGPAAASCTADPMIIDEFPPYVWKGPGACAKWLAGFDALTKSMAMTDIKIAGGKTLYLDGTASLGEVVVATRMTAMMGGKSIWETGAWTFVLTKASGAWKVASVGWSHTADNM